MLIELTRQNHLVIWRRSGDEFFTVCCYLGVKEMIGDMKKGETKTVEITIKEMKK